MNKDVTITLQEANQILTMFSELPIKYIAYVTALKQFFDEKFLVSEQCIETEQQAMLLDS